MTPTPQRGLQQSGVSDKWNHTHTSNFIDNDDWAVGRRLTLPVRHTWPSQVGVRQTQAAAGLPDAAALSGELPTGASSGRLPAVLSADLRYKTLLRQLEAAFTVEPLAHVAATFPRGAPGGIPVAHLVPARLLEHEPDVPGPEQHVYESKHLAVTRMRVNGGVFNMLVNVMLG